jgi:hypothetical protein
MVDFVEPPGTVVSIARFSRALSHLAERIGRKLKGWIPEEKLTHLQKKSKTWKPNLIEAAARRDRTALTSEVKDVQTQIMMSCRTVNLIDGPSCRHAARGSLEELQLASSLIPARTI